MQWEWNYWSLKQAWDYAHDGREPPHPAWPRPPVRPPLRPGPPPRPAQGSVTGIIIPCGWGWWLGGTREDGLLVVQFLNPHFAATREGRGAVKGGVEAPYQREGMERNKMSPAAMSYPGISTKSPILQPK